MVPIVNKQYAGRYKGLKPANSDGFPQLAGRQYKAKPILHLEKTYET